MIIDSAEEICQKNFGRDVRSTLDLVEEHAMECMKLLFKETSNFIKKHKLSEDLDVSLMSAVEMKIIDFLFYNFDEMEKVYEIKQCFEAYIEFVAQKKIEALKKIN